MKIAVIGGGGVRTPLLVQGLSRSHLSLGEVALYDIDSDRLSAMAEVARGLSPEVPVTTYEEIESALEGAQFVFTSIRVGGIEQRARDEQALLDLGLIGQETVGAGGCAMALRTIEPMISYARLVEEIAPRAWIVNFTNPVSIITQAVRTASKAKIIGICDTPTELFEEVAFELGFPSEECYFDFFGLNHLGWLREVYHLGEPQLHRIWSDDEKLEKLYRAPLFELDFLRQLRLLPTEYLYYYYRPSRALAKIREAGTSRGQVVVELNRQLWSRLSESGVDPVREYNDYLAARDAGYMQIESGVESTREAQTRDLTGYDKIALALVEAIQENSGALIPLNVPNRGNFSFLEEEDIVEVPCRVGCSGVFPMHVGVVPDPVRDWIIRIKKYERLTIEAALSKRKDDQVAALSSNPLIPSEKVQEVLAALNLS